MQARRRVVSKNTLLGLGLGAALCVGLVGATSASTSVATEHTNACGCRQDESSGACYCDRKAKCGCPGECEPKGCAEKRNQQLKKEVELEAKKATEAARKRNHKQSVSNLPTPASSDLAPAKPLSPQSEPRMSDRQLRALRDLIDLYLVHYPEMRQMTLDEASRILARSTGEHRAQ